MTKSYNTTNKLISSSAEASKKPSDKTNIKCGVLAFKNFQETDTKFNSRH